LAHFWLKNRAGHGFLFNISTLNLSTHTKHKGPLTLAAPSQVRDYITGLEIGKKRGNRIVCRQQKKRKLINWTEALISSQLLNSIKKAVLAVALALLV
jgi:hypothetical protein